MKTENISITQNPYSIIQAPPKPEKVWDTSLTELFKAPFDTYTPSVKEAFDPVTVESLWKETNHMGDAVRKLIMSALGTQDASGQGFWALRAKSFKISKADRAQAEALVSEDGYFGVKQTTDRLVGFAKALVGENASNEQIDHMRKAVQKGFDEVARAFGGFDKLPEVTKKTYEAVMKAFDEWKTGTKEADAE